VESGGSGKTKVRMQALSNAPRRDSLMRVYFLRHGVAEERSADGTDASRRLTRRGEEESEALGRWMARLGIAVDAIITSPLERAARTASLVAAQMRLTDRLRADERIARRLDVQLLAMLAEEDPESKNLLIVGHEPTMSGTISSLIGGGYIVMKKGALALVEAECLEPGGGSLVWLVTPKLIPKP